MKLFRRATIGTAALALTALTVACGRFVTPEPGNGGNGNLSGKMVITFRTNGTMDFNNVSYQIVINTCGSGEPYPQPNTTQYTNYSYIFAVGQGYGGQGSVLPDLFQIFLNQGTSQLQSQPVPGNASLEQFVPAYNGQPNQFQLIFTREQLDNALGVSQPCPNLTPATSSPGSSPSASVSASASASASATSGTSPTPSAGASPVTFARTRHPQATTAPSAAPTATALASPNAQPTTFNQHYWFINFFTAINGQYQDSLGQGGATDNTYYNPIDTTATAQNAIFKATGGNAPPPSNPAAQITGGEIDNYL